MTEPESKNSKLIVRGSAKCEYHSDILSQTESAASKKLQFKCLGGGRIQHDPSAKTMKVYGHSQVSFHSNL